MKVKFNRKRLIAALKKSRATALAEYRKNVREFHGKHEQARARFLNNLAKYVAEAKAARNGDLETEGYEIGKILNKGVDWPSKANPPRLDFVDALIDQLELSDQQVVTCDTKEEYVRLTRACAILGTCKV